MANGFIKGCGAAIILVAVALAAWAEQVDTFFRYTVGRAILAPHYGPTPRKGETRADPTTGVVISRVSASCELTPKSTRSLVAYSRFSPVSTSGEYLLVHGDNSTSCHVYRIRDNMLVATLTYDANPHHTIGEINEIRWDYSGQHPTRIYFVREKKFYQMDVLRENGSPVLIRDFGADFTEGSIIANDVEGDSSSDSRYWAWQVLDKRFSPYKTRLIFTYDKEKNAILGVLRPQDVGYKEFLPRPNMVEISPLGTKVITHYGAASRHPSVLKGHWVRVGNGAWELAGYKRCTSGNSVFASVAADGVSLCKMSTSSGDPSSITGDNQYANNSASDKFWVRLAGGADPHGKGIVADWGIRPHDVGSVLDAPRAWDLDFRHPVPISVSETHSGWAFDAAGREWFVSQNNRTDWIEARDILTGEAINVLHHGDIGWSNGFHFGKFYDRSQRGWIMISTYSRGLTAWGCNQILFVELKHNSANPAVWRIAPTYNDYGGNYRDEGAAALGYDGKTVWIAANWGRVGSGGEVYRFLLPDAWYEHFAGPLHPDTTAPAVTAFSVEPEWGALRLPITSFSARDGVGVTGYKITETPLSPAASAAGWSKTPPISFLFATPGHKVLHAWAKDAAGNVSSCGSAQVFINIGGHDR